MYRLPAGSTPDRRRGRLQVAGDERAHSLKDSLGLALCHRALIDVDEIGYYRAFQRLWIQAWDHKQSPIVNHSLESSSYGFLGHSDCPRNDRIGLAWVRLNSLDDFPVRMRQFKSAPRKGDVDTHQALCVRQPRNQLKLFFRRDLTLVHEDERQRGSIRIRYYQYAVHQAEFSN